LLFILAVVHTALAFGLYTAGLTRLDAGQAAIVATVEPVAAGAIGVALFGEEISAPKLLGALLVLVGAALAQV
jgi:DME family drug/metabolite transporter